MPGYVLRNGSSGNEWRKIYDLQAQVGSSWHRVNRAYVLGSDKKWHQFFQYVAKINTAVDVSSTSGLSITDAPNTAYTVTGVLRNADTRTALTGGLTVKLTDGKGTVYATTTTASNGAFTLAWKPTKTGNYTPTVVSEVQGVYQASSWSEGTLKVSSNVAVNVTWPSKFILGQPVNVTGTVKSATGEAPQGTLAVSRNGLTVANNSVNSDGSFSIQVTPTEDEHGTYSYYVQLSPSDSGRFPASSSSKTSITGYQPTPSAPDQSVSSITNSSVKIKVEDQAYVNYFLVHCNETGNNVRLDSTGTAGADLIATWSIGSDSAYHFVTTAYSDNPTSGYTQSSKTITATTGHDAVKDVGSGTFTFNPMDTASWRSLDGWNNGLGTKLGQGFYSTTSPYYGLASFESSAMSDTINKYGGGNHTSRADNISTNKMEVYTSRVDGTGDANGVNINFYCTTSMPNGNVPSAGNSLLGQITGPAPGDSEWDTLPSSVNGWFNSMLNVNRSLMMFANNKSQYSVYYGGSSFKLRATVSWNYTETPYKAPTYSNG